MTCWKLLRKPYSFSTSRPVFTLKIALSKNACLNIFCVLSWVPKNRHLQHSWSIALIHSLSQCSVQFSLRVVSLLLENHSSQSLTDFRRANERSRSLFTVQIEGARVAQWWVRPPPTNVARVQVPVSTPYVSWVCCHLVLSLATRGFSPGIPVYPSP